jgi:hypothetical protein
MARATCFGVTNSFIEMHVLDGFLFFLHNSVAAMNSTKTFGGELFFEVGVVWRLRGLAAGSHHSCNLTFVRIAIAYARR